MSRRSLTVLAACAAAIAGSPGIVAAHGSAPPEPELPQMLFAWTWEPLAVIGLASLGLAWLVLVRIVARRHPGHPVPARRQWAFWGGLAVLVLALLSPIDTYSDVLLVVHMAQHMLLMLVAAPLLLLAAPMTTLLRAVSPTARKRLVGWLHSRPARILAFPLLAWMVFAAVNWGWHLSDLYNQALEIPALHVVEHAVFLGAALVFWFPVIGADPGPWRMPHPARLFYLFLAMPQNSFLGVAIMSAGVVLYPHYASVERSWGPTPLEDQALAGLLMWTVGDVAFLVAMGLVVAGWVSLEQRRTARSDARLDAEMAAAELAGSRSSAE
jgi:putative copper resistance protein D